MKHVCENINQKECRKFEYYFLCRIIFVRKYAYILLQLIERLFFKSSNVKIKKIFKFKIKNHVRQILFRI